MKYKYERYNIVKSALMKKGIKGAEFQYNKSASNKFQKSLLKDKH